MVNSVESNFLLLPSLFSSSGTEYYQAYNNNKKNVVKQSQIQAYSKQTEFTRFFSFIYSLNFLFRSQWRLLAQLLLLDARSHRILSSPESIQSTISLLYASPSNFICMYKLQISECRINDILVELDLALITTRSYNTNTPYKKKEKTNLG